MRGRASRGGVGISYLALNVDACMSSNVIPLATAAVLGFLHALDVDHMLAVTAFVSRTPKLGTAIRFGFRWGLGHSIAVLAAGGVLLVTGLHWGARWERVAEGAVGLMLVGIGLWSMRSTRNLHVHLPAEHGDHAHLHTHPDGTIGHGHTHHPKPSQLPHAHEAQGVSLVGLLHGLAGTTAAVALLPVTLIGETSLGFAYLIVFGIGVTGAMTLFAGVTAVAIGRVSSSSVETGRRVSRAVGGAGVVVGIWWLWRAISP